MAVCLAAIAHLKAAGRSLLVGAGLLALLACQDERPDYPSRQMPERFRARQHQAAGHEIFLAKCAACHGKPSESRSERADFFQPPAMDFTDRGYAALDPAYLFWRIEVGKTVEPYRSRGSVMPAWRPHLTDAQIWQLVAYLKTRSH